MTNLFKNVLPLLFLIGVVCGVNAQTQNDGLAAMQLDQWDKAIQIFSGLTKSDPNDVDAWLTLSNAYLAKGAKADATQALKSAIESKGDAAMIQVATGRLKMLEGDMAEAENQFRRAGRTAKKNVDPWRQIGEFFLFFKPGNATKPDLQRAEAELKKAYDLNPKDFRTLMSLGYCYLEMNEGGKAVQYYEYASNRDPKAALPLYLMSRAYKSAKINFRFEEYIKKALDAQPDFTPALRAIAEYYFFDERELQKATEAYKDLVSKGAAPQIEDEMQLANCLYLTKDYKGCIDLVNKIIAKDPTKLYYKRLLGYCYYETEQYEKSAQTMKEYFAATDKEKIVARDYVYQGRLRLRVQKDTLGAIQSLEQAIKMDGSNWKLYAEIADLHYDRRDVCSAAKAFQVYADSATADESLKATDLYKLGTYYYYCRENEQRYEKAAQAFALLTERAPSAMIGWEWLLKSLAKTEVDLEAEPGRVWEYGKAKEAASKVIEIGATDPAKYKAQLEDAYGYMLYYHFSRGEKAAFDALLPALEAVNPSNSSIADYREFISANGFPPVPPKE
ncbi:MAG: tetratricopeptide repeat protein [Saprospiraceae bacterium]